MKSKLLGVITLFLSLTLITTTVDARRFGGSTRSFSRSWSKVSRPSKVASASSRFKRKSALNLNRTPRRSMVKGTLMGLLAGTMIGSLLGGHGFAGFHFLEMFLLFGLGFLIVKAISHFRRT
jgi:predicted lipid-binding transport protein (Tim44 family)